MSKSENHLPDAGRKVEMPTCSNCEYCQMPEPAYPAAMALCLRTHQPQLIMRDPAEATCPKHKAAKPKG